MGAEMTCGGGCGVKGGLSGWVAASACRKLLAVVVKPTAAPPMATTALPCTSMSRATTAAYWVANSAVTVPDPPTLE